MILKKHRIIYLLILMTLASFHSLAMDEMQENKAITCTQKTHVGLFQQSQKYLVHIGFMEGLPTNGMMRPGKRDAANYFCINGLLPSNDHMPHLDDAKFVVILKLTDTVLKRIVGFHVTEVLVAGEIDLCTEECRIIAPETAKIPKALSEKIVLYKGNSLEKRNAKTMEFLKELGAYPISLQQEKDYYGKLTWSNTTVSNVCFGEDVINVNDAGNAEFFSNILVNLPGISYACPAGSYDYDGKENQIKPREIGHLSFLKGAINEKNKEKIGFHKEQLIGWTNTLTHLDLSAREDFIDRVNSLGREKEETCIIS